MLFFRNNLKKLSKQLYPEYVDVVRQDTANKQLGEHQFYQLMSSIYFVADSSTLRKGNVKLPEVIKSVNASLLSTDEFNKRRNHLLLRTFVTALDKRHDCEIDIESLTATFISVFDSTEFSKGLLFASSKEHSGASKELPSYDSRELRRGILYVGSVPEFVSSAVSLNKENLKHGSYWFLEESDPVAVKQALMDEGVIEADIHVIKESGEPTRRLCLCEYKKDVIADVLCSSIQRLDIDDESGVLRDRACLVISYLTGEFYKRAKPFNGNFPSLYDFTLHRLVEYLKEDLKNLPSNGEWDSTINRLLGFKEGYKLNLDSPVPAPKQILNEWDQILGHISGLLDVIATFCIDSYYEDDVVDLRRELDKGNQHFIFSGKDLSYIALKVIRNANYVVSDRISQEGKIMSYDLGASLFVELGSNMHSGIAVMPCSCPTPVMPLNLFFTPNAVRHPDHEFEFMSLSSNTALKVVALDKEDCDISINLMHHMLYSNDSVSSMYEHSLRKYAKLLLV